MRRSFVFLLFFCGSADAWRSLEKGRGACAIARWRLALGGFFLFARPPPFFFFYVVSRASLNVADRGAKHSFVGVHPSYAGAVGCFVIAAAFLHDGARAGQDYHLVRLADG